MKKKWLAVLAAMAFGFTMCSLPSGAKPEEEKTRICAATLEDDFAEDTVIVVLKQAYGRINKKHTKNAFPGLQLREIEDLTYIEGNPDEKEYLNQEDFHQILKLTLKKSGKDEVLKAIKKLEKQPEVLSAEPGYRYRFSNIEEMETAAAGNVPSYTNQWALTQINATQAWGLTTGTQSVKVGVIDSGISSHPDLNANLAAGWDFYGNTSDATDYHNNSHGTHVAGIIGATGAVSGGVIGICPNVTLVPMRVMNPSDSSLDEPGYYIYAIVAAITYSINNNIPIINCSFGSLGESGSMEYEMANYSGLIVCSAGNDGKDTDVEHYSPAGANLDNIISVANSKSDDELSYSSNRGVVTVDLAAPGSEIRSTVKGNGYAMMSGTSMAAPYVAGVAALIKSVRPDLTSTQIKSCILEGVDPISALQGEVLTGGRLNAYNAVSNALALSKNTTLSGDFNGDGKPDLLLVSGLPDVSIEMHVRLNGQSSYTTWKHVGAYAYDNIIGRIAVGDFNGDGKDDVAFMYDNGSASMEIHVFTSTGYSFNNWSKWTGAPEGYYDANKVTGRFAAGDVDGDGKDDIVAMYDYGNAAMKMHTFRSYGNRFSASGEIWYTVGTGIFDATRVTERFILGDFNGDGKDDVACMYDYGNAKETIFVAKSTGTSFSGLVSWQSLPAGSFDVKAVSNRFVAGDFNGDGKDDVACMYDYGNAKMAIHNFISTGTAFDRVTAYNAGEGTFAATNATSLASGDFNNDGKDDLMAVYLYPSGAYPLLFRSLGTTYDRFIEW